jgi:ribosomal protein L27
VSYASKVSGGSARNQAGAPRRKHKQFHVFLDTPVSPKEILKEQRFRYGQDRHSRLPEYRPGNNVVMDSSFTLRATTKGVVSIRRSRIDPNYKWLDVEPDIQMVRRGNALRKELLQRGEATLMVPSNETYRAEYDKMMEPNWRERVLMARKPTERFVDPNLFARGVVPELKPMDRFCYE